jgi:hypothetical protein
MEERVRAAVRLLPLPPEAFRSLRVEGTDVIIKARHGQDASLTHAMDQVFPEDCSQGDVYDWVAPAVEDVARKGVNALCGNRPVILFTMAWKLHTIEQTQLRRQHLVDGVGRPKFDFHTGQRHSYGLRSDGHG